MSTRRNILKGFIIIILAVFLLSTALVSVMYLSNKKGTGTGALVTGADLQSGIVVETGIEIATGDTGAALPTLSKEEAKKELQNLLSGVVNSGANETGTNQ